MFPRPNRNVQPPNHENFWLEALKTVGLSLFLAFGIRAGVAQSFFIPSGSMKPTLQINDRLMVDKLSYHFTNPQRGDIVVFMPPNDATAMCGIAQKSHDAWIKRVIGLPGEKIAVKGGRVYVNAHPLRENYIAQLPQYQWGPVTVPPSSYLVLGDNRNNSCDGHYWGFLPRENLVGRAFIRYWPLERVGQLNQHPTIVKSEPKHE